MPDGRVALLSESLRWLCLRQSAFAQLQVLVVSDAAPRRGRLAIATGQQGGGAPEDDGAETDNRLASLAKRLAKWRALDVVSAQLVRDQNWPGASRAESIRARG